jgi:hypothetical protein
LTTDTADEIRAFADENYDAAKKGVQTATSLMGLVFIAYAVSATLVFLMLDAGSFAEFGAFGIVAGIVSLGIMRRAYGKLTSAYWYVDRYRVVELVSRTTGYGTGTDRNSEYHFVGDVAYEELREQGRSVRQLEFADLGLIALGTLQTSYGDWLHNFIFCGKLTC